MEEIVKTPNPPIKDNNHKLLIISLFLILLISIGINIFLISHEKSLINLPSKESSENKSDEANSSTNDNWSLPKSRAQGFPIAKIAEGENTRNLFIYSISENKLENLNVQVDAGGGAAGSGESEPVASPNLYYTAYIDKDKRNLWITSNETLEKRQITKNGHVSYISGWSPDSKSIIYLIEGADIGGMGGPQSQKYDPKLLPGFHHFNIETGIETYLYPVSSFEKFIDNDNIMVRSNDNPDLPYIFNISGFQSDRDTIKEAFGFESGQFNFSPDGKNWAFLFSSNPTDDNSIVYSNFPNKKGTTVDTGGWADTQWPLISPNNDKIAYQKREGEVSPGNPKHTVWLYNINSKNKEKLTDGTPKAWVGNNKLVIQNSNGATSINDSVYYIIDLNSGQSIKIN